MLRTIWGDHQRYVDTYWAKFQGRFYVAGDSAHRDEDGYFWIMGRIDDVLNVAGHRLGTMEIESALVSHPRVAEAAVVGRPHEIKGESVFAYVVCRGPRPGADARALTDQLRTHVAEQLGGIARPDDIRFADNLPKTRSGKIMRRLLRAIARGEPITQDVSTLENPGIIDQLRGDDSPRKPARPRKPVRPKKPARHRPSAPAKSSRKAPAKRKAARKRKAAAKRKQPKAATRKRTPRRRPRRAK
jgi:acetyl-CoA synthetase